MRMGGGVDGIGARNCFIIFQLLAHRFQICQQDWATCASTIRRPFDWPAPLLLTPTPTPHRAPARQGGRCGAGII